MKKGYIGLFITILLLLTIPIKVSAEEKGPYNIGEFTLEFWIGFTDVAAGSNYLYVTMNDWEMHLLILTKPTPSNPNPTIVGTGNISGSFNGGSCVDVNEDETIVVVGYIDSTYHNGSVRIFNITDKTNATVIDCLDFDGEIWDVRIIGDYIYCAADDAGIPVINITDLNDITIRDIYSDSRVYRQLHWNNDNSILYAAVDTGVAAFTLPGNAPYLLEYQNLSSADILSVVSISNSRIIAGDGACHLFLVQNTTIPWGMYLINYDHTAWHYDLANPGQKSLLFLARGGTGLAVVDYSELHEGRSERIDMANNITNNSRPGMKVMIDGNYVYLLVSGHGLLIYNLADCLGVFDETTTTPIPGFESVIIVISVLIVSFGINFKQKKRYNHFNFF